MFFNNLSKNTDTELYDILGVSKTSTDAEIKKSYRKLAMKYHPDRNNSPEAEAKFKKISMAYDVLSDKTKKDKYDNFGKDGLQNMNHEGPDMGSFDIFNNLFGNSDFFSSPFGRQNVKRKTKDKVQHIEINLEDIYNEKRLNINYKKNVVCKVCSGLGTMNPSNIKKCGPCEGKGKIIKIVQIGPNMISQSQSTCNKCNGLGKSIHESDKCGVCYGNKIISETKNLKIDFKNTFKHKQKIVFGGEADQAIDVDEFGDLIIIVLFKEHKHFKIKNGYDLQIDYKIKLSEALCGFKFKTKRLNGKDIELDINEVIDPYTKKVIRGEGLNNESDLIINFIVTFPERMGQERKTYIGKLLNYTIPKLNKDRSILKNYEAKKQQTEPDTDDLMDDPINSGFDPMDHGVECHQQ